MRVSDGCITELLGEQRFVTEQNRAINTTNFRGHMHLLELGLNPWGGYSWHSCLWLNSIDQCGPREAVSHGIAGTRDIFDSEESIVGSKFELPVGKAAFDAGGLVEPFEGLVISFNIEGRSKKKMMKFVTCPLDGQCFTVDHWSLPFSVGE
jgi:hypothetical protein